MNNFEVNEEALTDVMLKVMNSLDQKREWCHLYPGTFKPGIRRQGPHSVHPRERSREMVIRDDARFLPSTFLMPSIIFPAKINR